MRTATEYLAGLDDGRQVWREGRVDSVLRDPVLSRGAAVLAESFEPADGDALLWTSAENGDRFSAFFEVPRSSEDLLRRRDLIVSATRRTCGIFNSAKVVGTDALFGLLTVLEGTSRDRLDQYLQHCRSHDLTIAVAQTDAKGHRTRRPRETPAGYVRIVEESPDGVVIVGVKCHTTFAPVSDEILILPTRALGPDEAEFAFAGAVPANAPGLKMVCSGGVVPPRDHEAHPLTSRFYPHESTTIFDRVFVPRERVFLAGEPELAGHAAMGFATIHRFSAISYKLVQARLLAELASRCASVNGIEKAAHVREKLARVIQYEAILKGMSTAAAVHGHPRRGVWVPDPTLTYAGKLHLAGEFSHVLAMVLDLAGGLSLTAPSASEMRESEIGAQLEQAFAAGASGNERWLTLNLVRDVCLGSLGGYNLVLSTHAEGSPQAQLLGLWQSASEELGAGIVDDILRSVDEARCDHGKAASAHAR